MDSVKYTVALVTLQADSESPVYLTNRQQNIIVDGSLYIAAPEMELEIPVQGGDLSASDGHIKGISSASGVLANMAGGYPYNQIKVSIREVELDSSLSVVASNVLFTGLVYQAISLSGTGYMELVIKDWKYYTDVLAGVPCSEQCYVSYFGDKMCQATVSEYSVTIQSITGTDVVLVAVPTVDDFLFNKGYFKLNGTSIKIKYWESGVIFQTSEPMPASWDGQVVTLVAGCDKMLSTCRNIHNNEVNFSGWGVNMVDYNSQTEDG